MKTQPTSIVVGVDGRPASDQALAFALREASLRGGRVEVVTTWEWTIPYDRAFQDDATEARSQAEKIQDDAVQRALQGLETTPEVNRHVVREKAGAALVRLSHDADYLVVGNSHKNLVTRTLLGSVSSYCLRHAHCPVVVVPHPAEQPPLVANAEQQTAQDGA
jgi:nucleotide-binding universal stress UspA family protein